MQSGLTAEHTEGAAKASEAEIAFPQPFTRCTKCPETSEWSLRALCGSRPCLKHLFRNLTPPIDGQEYCTERCGVSRGPNRPNQDYALASRCTPTFNPGYGVLTLNPVAAGDVGNSATYGLTVTLVAALLSADWIRAKLSRLGMRKVKALLELMAGENAGCVGSRSSLLS